MTRLAALGSMGVLVLFAPGCSKPSSAPTQPMGYVIVEQDGKCTVRVDGKPWKHGLHERGAITIGHHRAECVDEAGHPLFVRELEVAEGQETPIFWGP